MDRRAFLNLSGSVALATLLPERSFAAAPDYGRLLVLVELKGGNDGLNTVVPFADAEYYRLRPHLAIAREQVMQLSDSVGLHPALAPLMPVWQAQRLAIVQGLGYPQPNLSHFRSIEIWETASRSDQYLDDGWLTRAFRRSPVPASFAADGVVIGSHDAGPLAGGARAIALADRERFLRQARLATDEGSTANPALAHVLKVEADVAHAAAKLSGSTPYAFRTQFPAGPVGDAIHTAADIVASRAGVAVIRLSLPGFDTHHGQPGTQANLLGQLAAGLVALKSALEELDAWNDALVMTYAEFGRRPRENQSNGTDHGTASVHFALGGRVRGGFYGEAPRLDRLDGDGNLGFAVDFRRLYATVLARWWCVDAEPVVGRGFTPLDFIAS